MALDIGYLSDNWTNFLRYFIVIPIFRTNKLFYKNSDNRTKNLFIIIITNGITCPSASSTCAINSIPYCSCLKSRVDNNYVDKFRPGADTMHNQYGRAFFLYKKS